MKQVVLIPHWVQETLNRHKLQLVDVLDFQKISGLISIQDLASLLAMDRFEQQCYGADVPDKSNMELRFAWERSAQPQQQALIQQLDRMSFDDSVRNDVYHRLFSPDLNTDYDTGRYPKAFITYDLSPTIAGVVIFPGHFADGSVHDDKSLALIESVLQIFYAYDAHHVVAQSELFKQYLRLLSNKTVIV